MNYVESSNVIFIYLQKFAKFETETLNHISRTPNSIKPIKNGIMFVFYLQLSHNYMSTVLYV